MSKTALIFAIILLMLQMPLPVSGNTVIDVIQFGSITEAIESIPPDAGDVTLLLYRSIFDEETDMILQIPADRGITEMIIQPAKGIDRVSLPGLFRICANGIPLTIGKGLDFENGNIYGGACVSEGETVLERSAVTIEGKVAFVFGGGLAENGAYSVVREPQVTIADGGTVYFEVFGGGHAYENGSRVFSESTTVKVDGTADYVLGGGFGEAGGNSSCEQTSVIVSENAKTAVALFSGGSASGEGSVSVVENAKAVLEGRAVSVFSGDFAYGGGVTQLNRASRVEILDTGSAEYAYLGSFASDLGTEAWVNTSELMNCGTVVDVFERSQTADNARAGTLITANFPCK